MAVYEINTFTIEKGADFDETFVIYNEDGSPLGINSSFTGVSKLRKYPTSETAYPFDVYLDDVNSSVNISMASTVTAALPFSGRCYFDVLLSYGFSDTTTKKFVKGTIIVQDTASL
jgi:hypothetical protein